MQNNNPSNTPAENKMGVQLWGGCWPAWLSP